MRKTVITLLIFVGFISIAATIDLDQLFDYSGQTIPQYINRDNTPNNNPISDAGATLGRVLFYDKQLSLDGSVSCASCHQQEFAFGDPFTQSNGLNGLTGRHSMRLVNARFSDEASFFWDERAATLEDQVTMPIQDHIEMGFSGEEGDPTIDSLIERLSQLERYQVLFSMVYGDFEVTEERMQLALAQFVRSIQSFDAPFDDGLSQVNNINANFPNFSAEENEGKDLFLTPKPEGGAGCAGCHNPPEFSIDPNSLNNGVIAVAGSDDEIDLTNTRAPSLREMINPDGIENGPFMHDGSLFTLEDVVDHYTSNLNNPQNTNLDPRLGGPPLNLTNDERNSLIAFLHTLSGTAVYTAEQWSDPFDENGELELIGGTVSLEEGNEEDKLKVFPNPFQEYFIVESSKTQFQLNIFDLSGKLVGQELLQSGQRVETSQLPKGAYILQLTDSSGNLETIKAIKN